MKKVNIAVLVLAGLLLVPPGAMSQPSELPILTDFKFIPAKIRSGDTVQYEFTYANIPGGLSSAVRDVEMWVDWQRASDRPVFSSRFVPSPADLAQHAADTGTFQSRPLSWRPPERVPAGGVEVKYTLVIKLRDGKKIERHAILRAE